MQTHEFTIAPRKFIKDTVQYGLLTLKCFHLPLNLLPIAALCKLSYQFLLRLHLSNLNFLFVENIVKRGTVIIHQN